MHDDAELFHRHPGNPVLSAADFPYPMNSVFNPGAALLTSGLAALPDRVPVEPSADARAAVVKPSRKTTLVANDGAKSKPGSRAGTPSTWKGQHDAR